MKIFQRLVLSSCIMLYLGYPNSTKYLIARDISEEEIEYEIQALKTPKLPSWLLAPRLKWQEETKIELEEENNQFD